jgi:hypothetical protein
MFNTTALSSYQRIAQSKNGMNKSEIRKNDSSPVITLDFAVHKPGLGSKISKRRGMFLDLAEDGVHPGALLAG